MFDFKRRIRDSASDAPTFVAPSTRFTGSIAGRGAFVCCGTVEGDCDIEGSLTVAEGGRWKGVIKATDIIVNGTVEGDLVARQRIEIAGTARVTGNLRGKSVAVAEGALIEGEIKITSGEAATTFHEKRQT